MIAFPITSSINHYQGSDYSSDPLKETWEFLVRLPEFQELIQNMEEINIVIQECQTRAYTDFYSSQIIVDPSLATKKIENTYPDLMGWMLFEICNFAQKTEFLKILDQAPKMAPDAFVEACERLEHLSALKTKSILRTVYSSCHWDQVPLIHSPENFLLFYLSQQAGGHSKRIYDRYAYLFPEGTSYLGTWNHPISELEYPYIAAFIDLRSRLDDLTESVYKEAKGNLAFLMDHVAKHDHDKLYDQVSKRIWEIESLLEKVPNGS